MLKAEYKPYTLKFKTPGGTSRGVLTQKSGWFIYLYHANNPLKKGIGECSILPKLSPDDKPGIEDKIKFVCENIDSLQDRYHEVLKDWPAVRFAVETAMIDLKGSKSGILYPSDFTQGKCGIPINGLIWMGTIDYMLQQIEDKIEAGFTCLKMKIGALDFEAEYKILQQLRKRFSKEFLELRVDANGAFTPAEAPGILERLAKLDIHSIEQPIMAGQWQEMALLCENTPLPIALDEELIGVFEIDEKRKLAETIRPQYLILKPGLLGGFKASLEWIEVANQINAGWWVTSALESNIGLNAIAQWTFTLNNPMPQGLGTGQVFTNNVTVPLFIKNGQLWRHA
ncbi:o-succinylbenzoate synthase [Thermophagus xiamenensis]|uniref:O-succinylbenzoate synthase n=1 Tax=Thermophagus xiamenensis TaxID=385682 RepID=A0A1I2DBQ8_9BACT|nr:o-succinylbenzoate synthase [Thermophagus xiamenensis]SFE77947.1 o-succinylbenzoate synthase [Thermophagus xiamenensis]